MDLMPESNLRKKEHGFPVQIFEVESFRGGKGMSRGKGEHELFFCIFGTINAGFTHRKRCNNKMIHPVCQSLQQFIVLSRFGRDCHFRVQ